MSAPKVIIRHLYFTGPGKASVGLDFIKGLNVVWGASNTGKSFVLKTLDFMFGKKQLPNVEERNGYTEVWLGLSTIDLGDVTLYRATAGGDFLQFDGLIKEMPSEAVGKKIQATQAGNLVLTSAGLSEKKVVKNEGGEKQALTMRTMIHHLLVDEGAIMAEQSPVHRGQLINVTAEKNILRLLLTGVDDSAVISQVAPKPRDARSAGKVELIDELVSEIDGKLGEDAAYQRIHLAGQLQLIEAAALLAKSTFQDAQSKLDLQLQSKREFTDQKGIVIQHVRDLELTLKRFDWLIQTYQSDTKRLEGLAEVGDLLALRTSRPCSLCGAAPEHQTHSLVAEEINRTTAAADGELRRLNRDERELHATIASLQIDLGNSRNKLAKLDQELKNIDQLLETSRKETPSFRAVFDKAWEGYSSALETERLFAERDSLLERRKTEAVVEEKVPVSGKPTVGIDGPTGHALAKTIEEVLKIWNFPGNPTVSFNDALQDIRVNGKDRRDNGKGVRAILHAAFKVATVLYRHQRELPQPGFLILDSPLVAYRDPLTSRYGALDEDEKRIAAATVADCFYRHLASLENVVQVIVLENTPPPTDLGSATIHVFAGTGEGGRAGLFFS